MASVWDDAGFTFFVILFVLAAIVLIVWIICYTILRVNNIQCC